MRNIQSIKNHLEAEAKAELMAQIERENIIEMLNQVFWEGYAETLSESEIQFYINQYRE
jgi:adenosine deaminase